VPRSVADADTIKGIHASKTPHSDYLLALNTNSRFDPTVLFKDISTITSDYSVNINDHTLLCDATAASFTLYLPTAVGISGAEYLIKKIDLSSNTITIQPAGTETIQGSASVTLSQQDEVIDIKSDGTDWRIISRTNTANQSVVSVFGRTGSIIAQSGDYNTDQVPEGTTNLYFNGKTTDNLPEGTTNKYDIDHFAGKTQDDLPDGTTYKQYNPASVAITGGSITGITDLSITDGGTGASDAATARANLGAAASGANSDITSLSGLTTPLSKGQGGTGNTTGDAATLSGYSPSLTPAVNDIPVVAGRPNMGNFIITGIHPATSATLTSNISSGYAMINGYVVFTPTTSHTYTASSDTYIFLDQNGNFTFSAVANGAAAPSKPANTVGVAKVVTDATAITSVVYASNNTANGANALYYNTTGYYNTASGVSALHNNTTGNYNTASGANALYYNTTGSSNTASGASALHNNTTGSNNTASGVSALFYNTTGYYNTASGVNALYNNTTGSNNTASGANALYYNTTGNYNTASGANALHNNTTGYWNTASGANALYYNTTGSSNTASGVSALFYNTTGYYNTASGASAGFYIADGTTPNQTSNYSVLLGANAKPLADGDTNEIVIGYNAIGNGSNTVTLGNDSITTTVLKGNIGINTIDQFGSGTGVLGIANATTAPTVAPTGGGVLYASAGALHWLGSSGTDTVIAAA